MQLNGKSGLALLIIGFGLLLLLNGFGLGVGLGKLMGIIIPLVIIFLGYLGIKRGRSLVGWSLLIIGSIILVGKLSGWIGLIMAIGLIIYGIFMLKKSKNAYE